VPQIDDKERDRERERERERESYLSRDKKVADKDE
jgi:ribosomal protein S30